jgi:hypothetical protein
MSSTITALTSGGGLAMAGDTSGQLELKTNNGTTAVTINTAQGAQFLNCIGVGNATPSTSGAGITFPATQSASTDANTLDDYEEGTWTPTARGQASVGTTTYSTAVGRYTKIGNQVTATLYMVVTSLTGTGTLEIANFPFTNNGGNSYTTGSCMTNNLDWPVNTTSVVLYLGPSRNYCEIYVSGDNVGWATAPCDNAFEILGTITYLV